MLSDQFLLRLRDQSVTLFTIRVKLTFALKKYLMGSRFPSIKDTTLTGEWSAAQPKDIFLDDLKKLEERSHKYVELSEEYIEYIMGLLLKVPPHIY